MRINKYDLKTPVKKKRPVGGSPWVFKLMTHNMINNGANVLLLNGKA